SGPVSPTVSETLSSEGANQSATGTCTDAAGNTASDTQSGIDIDLTPPTNIQWVGGPADGGSYYFGFVPAAPTCTAEDALSGLAGCVVSGYGTSVGSYTMTATATDNADNVATATRTYTVLAWEVFGFYRPVDPIPTVNVVKAGSTVPLKFEAFAGSLELTNTTIVDSLTYRQVQCGAFEDMSESPVELTATGGTVLRYDWTAGQFVFNWKTPSTPNKCYTTTLLFDDGSTISAYFKLK
ncbi:MAG TPA: PxKF domain-containing protein, partial [Candidatus Binatia bacterium]|nr:PxKF domain-containing protein [Candidatus Binatia bacterium]